MNQKSAVMYYLILSIIGATLLIALSIFGSDEIDTMPIVDKMFIGGAFIFCCLFGISLALNPGWTARLSERGGQKVKKQHETDKTIKRRGHHPDCEGFKGHTFHTKRKTLCAGCTGLALGAVISMFLTVIYIALPIELSKAFNLILIMLGLICITFNYIMIIGPLKNSFLHLISNIFLVVGFFFVIIGVFQVSRSLFFGIIGVIISFLWLDTRIRLSSWRHIKICENCSSACKAYSD
ncbi:MAG: hypothetical protein JSV56_02925 [Methanomassiliicoccales archaeon]|nr:MAG: hypothetical protein JSV56_02925 [Methanomassiliicoccales archaeon]